MTIKSSVGPYRVKLIACDDGSGDAWLPLPDDVMAALGWEIGDSLSLRSRDDGAVILDEFWKRSRCPEKRRSSWLKNSAKLNIFINW